MTKNRQLAHQPLASQLRALSEMLHSIPELSRLLHALPEGVWIGAGSICQPFWNLSAGHHWRRGLKDLDVLFFDPDDMTSNSEDALAAELADHFPDDLPPDVVNVARVHTWYEAEFGKAIAPYPTIAASIATWPTLASSIAVRGGLTPEEVIAPFGLTDLLSGVIRPNAILIPREVYEKKVARWAQWWPELDIHPWAPE